MGTLSSLIEKWKTDYDFRTLAGGAVSLGITSAFALYNGFLGIRHSSIWHGTICAYYLVLVLLRVLILSSAKKAPRTNDAQAVQRRVYLISSVLFFLLNLSLAVPVSIMTIQKKPVNMTFIPAIAMAAYTTYKIIMASLNFKRRKRTDNSLLRLLRVISFIEALVAVMTLQNTLIMVVAGDGDPSMLVLSAVTNAAMMFIILLLSAGVLLNGIRAVLKRGKSSGK